MRHTYILIAALLLLSLCASGLSETTVKTGTGTVTCDSGYTRLGCSGSRTSDLSDNGAEYAMGLIGILPSDNGCKTGADGSVPTSATICAPEGEINGTVLEVSKATSPSHAGLVSINVTCPEGYYRVGCSASRVSSTSDTCDEGDCKFFGAAPTDNGCWTQANSEEGVPINPTVVAYCVSEKAINEPIWYKKSVDRVGNTDKCPEGYVMTGCSSMIGYKGDTSTRGLIGVLAKSDGKCYASADSATPLDIYIYCTPMEPPCADNDMDKTICEENGYAWSDEVNTPNKCCGDDEGDVGFVTTGNTSYAYMCVNDGGYKWINALETKGCIYRIKDFDVYSDGSTWYACIPDDEVIENFSSPAKIIRPSLQVWPDGSGSALCYDRNGAQEGGGTFAVCQASICGTSGESYNIGERLSLPLNVTQDGQTNITNVTFYCSVKTTWEFDLECDYQTCQEAGFTYTGSKCCGDDFNETYNDRNVGVYNPNGGCMQSTFIASQSNTDGVVDIDDTLYNYDGWFYACHAKHSYKEHEENFTIAWPSVSHAPISHIGQFLPECYFTH